MQSTWLLLLTFTLLLSSLHSPYISTHAQKPPLPFIPTPLFHSQSVFIERQKLFIRGGLQWESIHPKPSSQTFYINLSKPWTTSNPIYEKLPEGMPVMGATTALSNNNRYWYSFHNGWVSKFNLQFNNWEGTASMGGIFVRDDLPAFVDPATNQLYILNGFRTILGGNISEIKGTIRINTTVPFEVERNGPFVSPSSSGALTAQLVDMGFFTVSWSTLKKTALIFGGIPSSASGEWAAPNPAPNPAQNTMYFYNPSVKDSISPASDTGDRPTARYDHCMVEAYNGTKMILFGGYDSSDTYYDDIYILDVATLKWSKGAPGGPTVARRRASCAVTNDLFVAWGGAITDPQTMAMTAVSQNVTIVYNLKTNQWQDTYSPNPYVPPPPTVKTPSNSGTGTGSESYPTGAGTDTGSNTTSDSNSSIGWIIGGAVGGLVVIGMSVALLFVCRRRRRQANKDKGSLHADPGVFLTSDIAGRQATKDNFYHNIVKGSPHTDPCALSTSNVAGSVVLPRYHNSGNSPTRLNQSTTRNPRSSFDPRVVLNTPKPERHPQASP